MKSLLDLPKDLLIKLIIVVESDAKNSIQSYFDKLYDRENKMCEGVLKVTKDAEIMVARCNFPGCKEIDVCDLNKRGCRLYRCDFGECSDKRHFCDAHDMLHYIKDIKSGDIFPCCLDCKKRLTKRFVVATKDISNLDINKIRKQLKEDEIRINKEKNKLSNYYSMSKQTLMYKVTTIANETKQIYQKEYLEELSLKKYIIQKIYKIEKFLYTIMNCEYTECKNFMIKGIDSQTEYYYRDTRGDDCIECRDIYYCREHLSHFPKFLMEGDETICYCIKCKDKKKD